MGNHMKTTIDIAEPLLQRAKKMAKERNTTLKTIIESALHEALEAQSRPHPKFRLETHVFKGKGLQAGLSWDDWSTIRSVTYEGRGG